MAKKQRTKLTRKKVLSIYRKYRAVLILTNSLSPEERKKLDKTLEFIERMDTDKISDYLPNLEQGTKDLCKLYGVIGSLKELEKAADIKPEDENHIIYIAKFALDRLFNHYEKRVPEYPKLPPHARIGIEHYGTDNKSEIDIFILEAALFEDLAALWNLSLELHQSLLSDYSKQGKKRLNALFRATAKAAFNLIEGYLNSLALDILVTQTVSDKEQSALTEWDLVNSRPKFLTLRDKLLQYPKIAVGAQHPPLTESNCHEIVAIVNLENRIRHSLIHPSPQVNVKDASLQREQTYLNLEIDDVTNLCDLTVDLIRRIDQAIGQKFGGVDSWLINRDATGFFPSKVFN